MKKAQRCALALSCVFFTFAVLLGVASYAAIDAVRDTWMAKDYWLAWFSAASLVASLLSTWAFGMSLWAAADCTEIEERKE